MEHNFDQLDPSKPQLRPSQDKPRNEKELEQQAPRPAPPRPRTNLDDPLFVTPEDRIRKALGLAPDQDIPEPRGLGPQMQRAIRFLAPQYGQQVMAVMGGLQALEDKANATSEKVEQTQEISANKLRQVSFAQRLIIRRAERGTLTDLDVQRARSIVAEQGNRGQVDPGNTGLAELFAQREEMLGAVEDMRTILGQATLGGDDAEAQTQQRAMAFVKEMIAEQAGTTTQAIDNSWGQFQNNDIERVAQIAEGRTAIQREQQVNASVSLGSQS